MTDQFPIYTQKNDCQDCYKCVRSCPVKAIEIKDSHAQVIPEDCILCGTCLSVCPVHAKKVRDDLTGVKEILTDKYHVYASIAPSWVGEFPGVSKSQMIGALKSLGFYQVGETALGAQEVSTAIKNYLSKAEPGLYLSTACPSVVEYVLKYLPKLSHCLVPFASPLLAHCRLLRSLEQEECKVVFIGPCVAKKWEADRHPEVLNKVITFVDLHRWFEETGIDVHSEAVEEQGFYPEQAEEGNRYPIEGGMIDTIDRTTLPSSIQFLSVSGIDHIKKTLLNLDSTKLDRPVFIECLACLGGCINGPGTTTERPLLSKWMDVSSYAPVEENLPLRALKVNPSDYFGTPTPDKIVVTEKQIKTALERVGKRSKEDELNCGGCGYNSCREFAVALVLGRAEETMCVSYMRQKAQKKANALLRTIPSGVIICDRDLKVIECNEKFARIFGEQTTQLYLVAGGLKGALLSRVAPALPHLFKGVMESEKEAHYDHFRIGEHLLEITVFSIEKGNTVGAVLVDVTRREIKRDQIAQRANEVIQRNISTVQEIACRLGEHMADTEILLRDISEGYGCEDEN